MIIFRIVLTFLFMCLGGFFSLDIMGKLLITTDVVKVDGILNIWGSYGSFLVGFYLLLYWCDQVISLPFSIGDFNRIGVILLLVVSPLLTIVTYAKLHADISDYVECTDLRKISSRYSSHTYAVSEELCQQALEEKAKRRR
ncbi:hypothetical protein [Vibrio spartinae]|uniref:Uncharacterized protein n=1 Tax=Vibrio spartinae TaxID=1918945 RepID=A0A1N6M7K1_9VIBR|nr:hypothetical protein [Vibrio spartinae]QMV14128.1 hypothetical protein Vspart_01379 [Vibrio spartinae]SIO95394.1 hypothetical protein VSP9026_03137 [Vibrio spartinae]